MTTTNTLPVAQEDSSEPLARVSLKPSTMHPGAVQGAWWPRQGAWWPRTRDLTVELPPLVAVLDENWTEIDRATVNVNMWPEIPDVLRAGPHNVHVGWFDTEQEPDNICVLTYLTGRWDLLVVPPETDPDRAAVLMAAASDVHNKQTASDLMASM